MMARETKKEMGQEMEKNDTSHKERVEKQSGRMEIQDSILYLTEKVREDKESKKMSQDYNIRPTAPSQP